MAKITYYGNSDPLDLIFDDATFGIDSSSKRKVVFEDGYGARVVVHGTGLMVSHGSMTGGTVISAEVKSASGDMVYDVEHAHIGAAQISHEFDSYGVTALNWAFAPGNDKLVGSKFADVENGYDGRDLLIGRGGDDQLLGARGNDVMTGEAGNDAFVFFRDCDVDTVTDFEDRGSRQDVIWTTRNMYRSMEMHQSGQNVVLDFGSGDELIIENAHVKNIGRDDFHFN